MSTTILGDASAPPVINSREWWEDYFAEKWANNHGSQQTQHFMERLIANLDSEITQYLKTQTLEIVDWGCAFGEGVVLLSEHFPHCRVVGLDYAEAAIAEARKLHPQNEFLLTKDGALPRAFDVIVTSNCLEHFARPLDIALQQLPQCRELYIALVPYDEYPLCEYHRSQFREESFPEKLGQFTRLSVNVIDVDPSFWPGQQLLVVYASPAWLVKREKATEAVPEREKWDRYYADLPLFVADASTQAFHAELVKLVGDLLPQGSTTLEAGCGAGWQSLALAEAGYQVSLLDFSSSALNYARRLFAREKQSANFVLGDALATGTPEYDLVFNAGALEHYTFDEQVTYLRAMASRSRRYVLVLVPNRACYWYWLWRIQTASQGEWSYGKEMPMLEMAAAFRAAGLQFHGETFVGSGWTESFIANLSGLSYDLAQNIMDVHRSPLIPQAEKSYLLAALGSVTETTESVPAVWTKTAETAGVARINELTGALADALAVTVQKNNELRHKEQAIKTLSTRNKQLTDTITKQQSMAAEAQARLAEAQARLAEAQARLAETEARLAEAQARLQALTLEHDQAYTLYQKATQELFNIQTSNYWKALSVYWGLRDRLRGKA